jgi:undecaprenyl diphosphate synthase
MCQNKEDHHIQNGKQQEKSENIIPRHVAFICDGNSRWAQARGLPASAGHLQGADRLISCLQMLKRAGVECCTFYGFSTENWKRSPKEISDILFVMEQTARKFYDKAIQEGVQVKILGELEDPRIPDGLRGILQKLENDTYQQESTLTVCIAINYGGRRDMVNASITLAKAIASGELAPDDVTEDDFSSLLCTCGIPDPDLMIRTGGEKRLSNFLLWNCAYSELYFSPALWPDFDDVSIMKALDWYSSRSRKFGGRKNNAEELAFTASTSTDGAP